MRHRTLIAIAAVAVMLAAGPVRAQYYTPLRYDLRMSNPTYIPSGTIQFGPADSPNPYAFGQPQYGNLGLTGNLRFGQSFQGHVPYNQQGDQLSIRVLPSLKLSDFRRDSYGVADIGNSASYSGAPEAYFPGSGSVTNLQSAMNRYAVPPPGDRPPMTLPSLNTPVITMPTPTAGNFYTPSVTPAGAGAEEGKPAEGPGIVIPQAALNWIDALIAGKTGPPGTTDRSARKAGEETGPGGAETNNPTTSPYGAANDRLLPQPDNILNPDKPRTLTPEEKAAAEAKDAEAALYRGSRGPALDRGRAAGPPPAKASAPAKLPAQTGGQEEEDAVPATPVLPSSAPPLQISTYAGYVEAAHAAMKQGAFEKAGALYGAAAVKDPNRPAAFFGRINAMLALRNFLQAAIVLQRELAIHPDWARLTPDIRLFYASPDVYTHIIANLRAQLDEKPGDLNYCLLLGYAHFAGGAKKEAAGYLEGAAQVRGSEDGAETIILKAIQGK